MLQSFALKGRTKCPSENDMHFMWHLILLSPNLVPKRISAQLFTSSKPTARMLFFPIPRVVQTPCRRRIWAIGLALIGNWWDRMQIGMDTGRLASFCIDCLFSAQDGPSGVLTRCLNWERIWSSVQSYFSKLQVCVLFAWLFANQLLGEAEAGRSETKKGGGGVHERDDEAAASVAC